MTFTRYLAAAVSGLILCAGVPGNASADPGSAGIGDKYFPEDGNGGYDVIRYNIHDRYRFRSGKLSGWTRVTARATQDLSRFNLDILLPVTQVRVNGRPAKFSKPNKHELRIRPKREIANGDKFQVKVTYAGKPANIGYLGERNWLASRHEVATMNEPHMAPWWFPANDHPQDKAKMRINITVPKGREVIANGQHQHLTGRKGLETWHWRADEPMAPYLAFFVAGDFSFQQGESDGLPWINAVSKRLSSAREKTSRALLGRTPDVVSWMESEVGSYPFTMTGGVVLSLDPGFALENQTRPLYPYLTAGEFSTIVHEIAHQWFGDDVAVSRWRDIWLNEGFATYFEVRYAETHGGPAAEAWLESSYAARDADSSFWKVRIARPGATNIFSSSVYTRGAMTLVALRNRIGGNDLRTLLRTWAAVKSGGNGSTQEFMALAEDVSGEQLDGFFDAWLFAGTKPADTAANGL